MKKLHLKIRFDSFVYKYYLPFVKTVKRSWQVDERIIKRHILSTFGDMKFEGITTRKVSVWLASLAEKGLQPTTCNRILAVFRSIFTFACKQGYLDKSPCQNIISYPITACKQRPLGEDEAKLLMSELKKHNNICAIILQLLLLTGARKSEILQARWENIDYKHKILVVPVSKSGKPRYIMLSDEAIQIIKKIPRRQNIPWLFPARNPLKPIPDIYHFWNKIRHKLGLEEVRIHDLRHSFASFLVNGGHSLYEVQKLLGHSDPRTTMRYAHLGNKALQEAAAFVSEIYTDISREDMETDSLFQLLEKIMSSNKGIDFLRWLIRSVNSKLRER